MSSDTFAPVPLLVRKEETPWRLVLLGKTGTGKSSFGNALIGQKAFEVNSGANSGTRESKAATKTNGKITVIDTPGFFDTHMDEANLKSEIVKSITECAPGPHAFLILLKVEKYTEHENQVITKIEEMFSEEIFKYAVLVFTYGDQLDDDMKIEKFVRENEALKKLFDKCGKRCHVVDNKYWNINQGHRYRNNEIQIKQLLNTIKEVVQQHGGGCYTNEMLQAVERNIKEEMERTGSREEAKKKINANILKKAGGVGTGVLLGAFFGQPAKIRVVMAAVFSVVAPGVGAAIGAGVGAVVGGPAGAVVGAAAGAAVGAAAAAATIGGVVATDRRRPAGYEPLETESDEEVEVKETPIKLSNILKKSKAE